ncbi:glycosyltransferase [Candidatus Chloroploca sp. M-50]|uniref:Glycosyltransferase n=1 Tax=Candidatus Chloroploca mongolica TaxID=2528176 RepID=A0ABS4D9L2_9CHLR|nr:glycosyltransferase [Candidatus Chloroploca mongolica]MBP1466133.1 glycosyltransferase [Candidatus Chloroploca mongolica]
MTTSSPCLVDIIIPTRNRGALVDTTITSIRACYGVNWQLWVLDQSDDDRTEQCVLRHCAEDDRIHYVRTASRGISAARNAGCARCTAPLILFTDDDCRVEPAWAMMMAAELVKPAIWAVFGRVLPETLTELNQAVVVASGGILATKVSTERRLYVRSRLDLSFGHGASMGVRREVLQRIGGFDELLGVGAPLRSWEDRDFGYRIIRAGGQIVYTPAAVIYHRQWRDWDAVRNAFRQYGLGAGAATGKYMRCGDLVGAALLAEWIIGQGGRQALSSILKWRSLAKLRVALGQFVYPWYGLLLSFRYPIDRRHCCYRSSEAIDHVDLLQP